jgi:hypothetical protein
MVLPASEGRPEMKYQVERTDWDSATPKTTKCGGPVKTVEKAYDLMARMRAQQPLGSSVSFKINPA